MQSRRSVSALWLVGAFGIGLMAACSHPPDPAHDADIATPDGLMLKGSYFSPLRPGPAILLFHQCNMDRRAWDGLTPDLVAAGFHVLTYDQRGFGDTGGRADQQKVVTDADAAYAYLMAKTDVDPNRVAAGGASCGVTYAAELAVRHQEVKTLLLLSGTITSSSRDYITATPSLAIFGVADEWDAASQGIRKVVDASKNSRSTLKIYERSGEHGVPMFAAHADLKPAIVAWLEAQLEVRRE